MRSTAQVHPQAPNTTHAHTHMRHTVHDTHPAAPAATSRGGEAAAAQQQKAVYCCCAPTCSPLHTSAADYAPCCWRCCLEWQAALPAAAPGSAADSVPQHPCTALGRHPGPALPLPSTSAMVGAIARWPIRRPPAAPAVAGLSCCCLLGLQGHAQGGRGEALLPGCWCPCSQADC
jgi:hypothetical protein